MALCFGCTNIFGARATTPRDVFEAFWKDFTQVYAYMDEFDFSESEFSSKKFELPDDYSNMFSGTELYKAELAQANFEILYSHYAPLIDAQSTWDQLYALFLDLENTLKDVHFTFTSLWDSSFVFNGQPVASYNQQHTVSTIPEDYAKTFYTIDSWEIEIVDVSHAYAWGHVKADPTIGYLHVRELVAEYSSGGRLFGSTAWLEKIDTIIDYFVAQGVTRLIIDLRGDARGSISAPQQMIGRFVTETKRGFLALERDPQGELSRESFVDVTPRGNRGLAGVPIVLVTNKLVRSGGEFFVLMLKARGTDTYHLGSRDGATLGVAGGIIERDLPDGVVVRYPSSKIWQIDADGSPVSYFRTGIMPDESVDVINGNDIDELMQRAIDYLNK